VEILRFGPGFRRRQPPAGSSGLADQPIWAGRGVRVTELAFAPRALMPPQTSPDLGLFIVVSGGGWIQIGDERSVINHGEAVVWPPGMGHGAWTDGSPMRAILVEVADPDIAGDHGRAAGDLGAEPSGDLGAEPSGDLSHQARGRLAPRPARPEDHDPSEGEPW
jgi:quercetin dioxygenase-like cupin family protein